LFKHASLYVMPACRRVSAEHLMISLNMIRHQ